jgi:hypothetical protein
VGTFKQESPQESWVSLLGEERRKRKWQACLFAKALFGIEIHTNLGM